MENGAQEWVAWSTRIDNLLFAGAGAHCAIAMAADFENTFRARWGLVIGNDSK